jgi:hypothetical protein
VQGRIGDWELVEGGLLHGNVEITPNGQDIITVGKNNNNNETSTTSISAPFDYTIKLAFRKQYKN